MLSLRLHENRAELLATTHSYRAPLKKKTCPPLLSHRRLSAKGPFPLKKLFCPGHSPSWKTACPSISWSLEASCPVLFLFMDYLVPSTLSIMEAIDQAYVHYRRFPAQWMSSLWKIARPFPHHRVPQAWGSLNHRERLTYTFMNGLLTWSKTMDTSHRKVFPSAAYLKKDPDLWLP